MANLSCFGYMKLCLFLYQYPNESVQMLSLLVARSDNSHAAVRSIMF